MVVIKLFAACTYEEIENRERDVENKEIVVFLFVRPSCKDAMDIVREFDYIHYNSGKYLRLFSLVFKIYIKNSHECQNLFDHDAP